MSRKVEITHPDKILYPKLKLSKKDIIGFYEDISSYLIPHLKDRPIVLQQYPEGVGKEGFYQQEVPDHYPEWISTIGVKRKGTSPQKMLEIHTKTSLRYVVNQNGICFHKWLSKKDAIDNPDYLVYDLDPSGNDFSAVVKAAKQLKFLLEEMGAKTYVMTTGSKGLHVVVPIKPDMDFDAARKVAKKIATRAVKEDPENLTTEIRKNKRKGKIFLDYLRNSYGQTTISPYSLRAIEGAPIATPLDWDELSDKKLNSQKYNAKNIFKRLSNIKDPWSGISRYKFSLKNLKL